MVEHVLLPVHFFVFHKIARMATGRICLISCMRNEGAHLIEWIAYNKVIGFAPIVVLTNDCTDGSDTLLKHLAAVEEVIHVDHKPAPGGLPQFAGLAISRQLEAVKSSEWAMVQDADEYLTLPTANSVSEFVDEIGQGSDAIAFLWRFFGTSGHKSWEGENILPTRTRTHLSPRKTLIGHKTLFRPERFECFRPHMPKSTFRDRTVVSTAGDLLPTRAFRKSEQARYQCGIERCTFEGGWIAHHALKAPTVTRAKQFRGFGGKPVAGRHDLGGPIYRKFDVDEVENTDILKRWGETEYEINRLLSDDKTRRLHNFCQDWLKDEIKRVAKLGSTAPRAGFSSTAE